MFPVWSVFAKVLCVRVFGFFAIEILNAVCFRFPNLERQSVIIPDVTLYKARHIHQLLSVLASNSASLSISCLYAQGACCFTNINSREFKALGIVQYSLPPLAASKDKEQNRQYVANLIGSEFMILHFSAQCMVNFLVKYCIEMCSLDLRS